MPLLAEEIECIAAACEDFDLSVFQLVGLALPFLPDAENRAKPCLTDDRPRQAIASAFLIELALVNLDHDYAYELFNHTKWSEGFKAQVGPVLRANSERDETKQALLNEHDHFISDEDMRRIREQSGPRTCCIAANIKGAWSAIGTGFLIAPDFLVTAMHVVDKVRIQTDAEATRRAGADIRAVFDFTEGNLVVDHEIHHRPRRIVKLDPSHWLRVFSAPFKDDGRLAEPSGAEILTIRDSLDFAVLKLAEPVGNETIRTQKRGWFEVGNMLGDSSYDTDQRVVLIQHPLGLARRFDIARTIRVAPCGTRLHYDLNSANGSSGAPCLSLRDGVIAMHNAVYEPHKIREANQGIRYDRIVEKIQNYQGGIASTDRVRPWRIELADGTRVPVIGREMLLDWLLFALDAPLVRHDHRDRLYVAHQVDRDDPTGLSFSADVVRAVVAGENGHRSIDLDGEDLRHIDPEDLAFRIGMELGIPDAELRAPPPRPAANLPNGAIDGDKLHRWASMILPAWFLKLAETHRHDAWKRVWIVLDDLTVDPLPPLAMNFVATLIGADTDSAAMSETARRFQWLFLGRQPPFLGRDQVTLERIEPHSITADDVKTTLATAYAERGIAPEDIESQATVIIKAATVVYESLPLSFAEAVQNLVMRQIRLEFDGKEERP